MILLTIGIGGLQIAWSVELSNGSPYLLSLGLSKSLMALVWIAGPLTGTLVQPYIGMLSDNCRVSWGKRKPFMLGGSIATAISLMFLGWTKEITGGIFYVFGADPQSNTAKVTIIVVAVLWVYILDFTINTVQAAIRAFIVDCTPPHQQETANSMASRILGLGNIIGYCAGYVDLPKYLWWLGDTQFKVLCSIGSIALCLTVLISTLCIPERDPRLDGPPSKKRSNVFTFFWTIFASIKRLPPQTKKVCVVQLFAWIGFFPELFYTSSYVGEIYAQPYLKANPHMTPEELNRLYEEATRVGTFALLVFAISSLVTNVFLPLFIAPTYDGIVSGTSTTETSSLLKARVAGKRKTVFDCLVIPGLTLRRAWLLSQVLFAISMFCTLFVTSVQGATVIIGLTGITWALTLWAPWAIISAEISQRDAMMRSKRESARRICEDTIPNENDSDLANTIINEEDHIQRGYHEEVDQAGVILGIHNMAIAAPQMLATVGSSIVFRFLQKPRGTPGDRSLAVVMALGGIFVLGAAYFVYLIDDAVQPLDSADATEEDVEASSA
ncbi:major facilitator superfamily domain-containing protein [Xylariales sp. PMI_506]|nr:major facilitator superfamily domain-containing protein [Xylariales sp. PMI_506]